MRETKKNHSQLLNLSKQIKTVTILKHYRTKQKCITQEEAKGKTDSQNMPNLPKRQNKTKRRKKKTK
jgi:hypothetical protein